MGQGKKEVPREVGAELINFEEVAARVLQKLTMFYKSGQICKSIFLNEIIPLFILDFST